jgi:hypothetical protein
MSPGTGSPHILRLAQHQLYWNLMDFLSGTLQPQLLLEDVQSPGSDMISQFGPGLNKNAIDHSNDCKANDQLMKNT